MPLWKRARISWGAIAVLGIALAGCSLIYTFEGAPAGTDALPTADGAIDARRDALADTGRDAARDGARDVLPDRTDALVLDAGQDAFRDTGPDAQTSQCGDRTCDPSAGEGAENCALDCAATKVAVGATFGCAILADETIWCWGDNSAGSLSDPSTCTSGTPVAPVRATRGGQPLRVVGADAGTSHVCAITASGDTYCWGMGDEGQLGTGSFVAEPTCEATRVQGISNGARLVALGGDVACAVDTADVAWCWGANDFGQLGIGQGGRRSLPAQIAGLPNVAEMTAGGDHTCAVVQGGSGCCWGRNDFGQLGIGRVGSNEDSPQWITGAWTKASVMAAGALHSCAVDTNGQLWCWGRNDRGQLGSGSTQDAPAPVRTAMGVFFSFVAAGQAHTCAVTSGGDLYCWGANDHGQLGLGDRTDRRTPTRVTSIGGVVSVAAGPAHTCAATQDGHVHCWGSNEFGQLGDGTTTDSATPVRVHLP